MPLLPQSIQLTGIAQTSPAHTLFLRYRDQISPSSTCSTSSTCSPLTYAQLPRIATRLAPEDAEIAFNLAAVLEAVGRLEDALVTTLCHSVQSCLMWYSEILQAEQGVWDRSCRDAHPQRKLCLLFLTSRLLPCWITGQCEDPWEEASRRRGGPSLAVMV
jgi:hypothetical protein